MKSELECFSETIKILPWHEALVKRMTGLFRSQFFLAKGQKYTGGDKPLPCKRNGIENVNQTLSNSLTISAAGSFVHRETTTMKRLETMKAGSSS